MRPHRITRRAGLALAVFPCLPSSIYTWRVPFIEINGASLYYRQYGEGDDVVFLHGAGGNHLSWWQQVPVFAARFRVTVYDARGWGRSKGDMGVGRWTLGTDLVALLEALGIGRAHIVAQSMGGRAVAGLIRHSPERVRSLVLCGTTAGASNDRVRAMQESLRRERNGRNLNEFSLADQFETQEPARATLFRQINGLNPPRPKGLLGKPPPGYRGSMHEAIAGLGVPVLWLAGEHDRIVSPELVAECAALVARSQVYVIKGAAHSSYYERPDEWNRVVLDFFCRPET
jgi:3-oxoadipate enol-lactonase